MNEEYDYDDEEDGDGTELTQSPLHGATGSGDSNERVRADADRRRIRRKLARMVMMRRTRHPKGNEREKRAKKARESQLGYNEMPSPENFPFDHNVSTCLTKLLQQKLQFLFFHYYYYYLFYFCF